MEIGSVIREKRTAQGLTQEQVATALGVSAPAVSKWERGESFPEITLLPALARLLGTDLNGLLSFQQEMGREEIAAFLGRLVQVADWPGRFCGINRNFQSRQTGHRRCERLCLWRRL